MNIENVSNEQKGNDANRVLYAVCAIFIIGNILFVGLMLLWEYFIRDYFVLK